MKELITFFFTSLYEFNKSWAPSVAEDLKGTYLLVITVIEVIIIFLILIKLISFLFRGLFSQGSVKKGEDVNYAGGFRRRFNRVPANAKVDYRLDSKETFKEGVLQDISLHGMKIEVNEEMPEMHQRIEFVMDGKNLKLKKDDRVKIGGFIVRVVEKKTNKSYDLGVEFYHLFRNQTEMIEAFIEKKKK